MFGDIEGIGVRAVPSFGADLSSESVAAGMLQASTRTKPSVFTHHKP